MINDYVNSRHAARLLGISTATIARLYRAGTLQGYKLTKGRNSPLRISRASIDRLLADRSTPPTPEPPSRVHLVRPETRDRTGSHP